MRKLFFVPLLLIAVAAMAQSTPPQTNKSLGASINAGENAKKARAVLDAMIEKLGGQAYLNVKDITQEGRTYAYYQGQPSSLGTLYWRFYKFPDKERVEYTKARDVVFIINGDEGYEITYKGTAAEDADILKENLRRREHSLETVLRIWLSDPNTALFYDGPAVAEQKPCDSVTLMNAKNDSVTIYVDTHTRLPVKKTFEWRDPSDKLKNEEGEVYDNFRVIDGIQTATTLLRTKNGEISNQRFLTNVQYNAGLADSLFDAKVTYDPNKKLPPVK